MEDISKLDKTAFKIASLDDDSGEKAFWFSKTPYERLKALEQMRRILYGYYASTARLQNVFEVAELTSR